MKWILVHTFHLIIHCSPSSTLTPWHSFFTFYELELSRLLSRRSIRFGMQEARKGNCGSKQCCLLSPALSPQFWKHSGEKTPWKRRLRFSECLLRLLSVPGKGHLTQPEKKGGGPSPPSLLSSSPEQGWQMAKLICFLLFAWAPGLGTKF